MFLFLFVCIPKTFIRKTERTRSNWFDPNLKMTELQPLTTRVSFTHSDYSHLPAATKGLHKYWYTRSIATAYLLYWASMAPALPGELRTDMPASRSSLATCSASTRTSRDFDPVTDIATWYGESSGWSCNICNKKTLISNSFWPVFADTETTGHFAMTFFKNLFSTIPYSSFWLI